MSDVTLRTYDPAPRMAALIKNAFVLKRPSEEQGLRLDAIRARAGELTLAIRALHQASQHAVTSILFNEGNQ